MSQKTTKTTTGDEEMTTEETLHPSDPLVVKSSKGKQVIVTKIKTPVEQEDKTEEISLREFKECPIEYSKEASLKEYEIEGNEDEN